MKKLIYFSRLFDAIEERWESKGGQRIQGTILVWSFIISILLIEINRIGLFPPVIQEFLPTNHLTAIEIVFTLLLVFEVISLIFSLVYSVSTSIGKQFEVLSLVLLRNAFKKFSQLSEPITWEGIEPVLYSILVSAASALLIFAILSVFYRIQKRPKDFGTELDKLSFILAKKLIALLLMVSFSLIVLYHVVFYFTHTNDSLKIFESFYTVLIFTDILIMLISLRYGSSYRIAFRNSGYAVTTLLIRFSLMAPAIIGSAIGVGSALFMLGIGFAYNTYKPSSYQLKKEKKDQDFTI